MKKISVICAAALVSCLLGLLVLYYLDGRLEESPAFMSLFPAEIVPLVIGGLAGLTLFYTTVASLMVRRDRKWTAGALAIVVGATALFWFGAGNVSLYGVRDRFVARVEYPVLGSVRKEQHGLKPILPGYELGTASSLNPC